MGEYCVSCSWHKFKQDQINPSFEKGFQKLEEMSWDN
jgi:hypothetical protein